MGQKRPPFEYLVASSKNSLEAFELARLNHASNLRKAMRQIVDEWVDAEVDGKIARWILECRREENLGTDPAAPSAIEQARLRSLAPASVANSDAQVPSDHIQSGDGFSGDDSLSRVGDQQPLKNLGEWPKPQLELALQADPRSALIPGGACSPRDSAGRQVRMGLLPCPVVLLDWQNVLAPAAPEAGRTRRALQSVENQPKNGPTTPRFLPEFGVFALSQNANLPQFGLKSLLKISRPVAPRKQRFHRRVHNRMRPIFVEMRGKSLAMRQTFHPRRTTQSVFPVRAAPRFERTAAVAAAR